MKIDIIVDYDDAEWQVPVWAQEEKRIDFRGDPTAATRCTVSFAATELKTYLARTLDADISFASTVSNADLSVELKAGASDSESQAYALEPMHGGLRIHGEGRIGVLYGVYEFLHLQGWRWYAPGAEGEVVPRASGPLNIPAQRKRYAPDFDLGRGFFFEGLSKESEPLLFWMARNRLNLSGCRVQTAALGRKLGMSPAIGTHLFEQVLSPDRRLPSGRTIWDEHPEWYGLPASGSREKAGALRTQFCVSQPSLLDFVTGDILELLNGEWRDADRIDVWGFDTWGQSCRCPQCEALGNSSDQYLHFASQLRTRLDQARADGRLGRRVRMVLCAYEGTATMDGPENRLPANLLEAGDYVCFFPIRRCYEHGFTDATCSLNHAYHQWLKSWMHRPAHLPVMVGEYYNVSKYEDLPLLFTTRLAEDLPSYHRDGCRGMAYMHLPMLGWGVRTLTQSLYARLCWDVGADVPAFLDDYFSSWYGPHARTMRRAYELIEEGWSQCGQWRNWGKESILSQLQAWDGRKPGQPLAGNDHLPAGAIVAAGRNSLSVLKKAFALVTKACRAEQERLAAESSQDMPAAVNPIQQREYEQQRGLYEKRLREDRRLLRYGLESMLLMVEVVAYHDALCAGDHRASEAAWKACEALAERLDAYYVPIDFETGAGVRCRDALSRVQLRECLQRCRRNRLLERAMKGDEESR